MDGPRLIHGNQPVTTDATLRRDLEASLAATSSNAPVSNAEIRAKLMAVEAHLDAISSSVNRLLEAVALLAANDTDLGHMIRNTVAGPNLAARPDDVTVPADSGLASDRIRPFGERPSTHGPSVERESVHD